MKDWRVIGYCVANNPKLASFRLRVDLPSRHLGMAHRFGVGDLTFFFKNGSPDLARRLLLTVYDVVNAHFEDPDYRAMCEIATVVTCSSEAMAGHIQTEMRRDAVVIPDPYENAESEPAVKGDCIGWIGHPANYSSIEPYKDLPIYSVPTSEWSREKEDELLACVGVVLLTGSNPGASANRVIKALRAGRFVVAPEDCPQSWREFSEYIWIGDVREGLRWAFNHREEACQKVASAQKFIRTAFSPQSIGSQWAALFVSTLGLDTSKKTAGSVLTSR